VLRPAPARLTGRRRLVATGSLGVLALSQAVVGLWALLAPRHFFDAFPAAGHAWVALLPPYNEHLVRDVGALSCALLVVLVVAAASARPVLVRTAALAFAVYAVPHTLFHGLHLEHFGQADATAQMLGFAGQLVLVALALAAAAAGPGERRDAA
jgi:hypothetical protein